MSQYMHAPNTVCQDETLGGGVGVRNGTASYCFETRTCACVRAWVSACVCVSDAIPENIYKKNLPAPHRIKWLFDSFF